MIEIVSSRQNRVTRGTVKLCRRRTWADSSQPAHWVDLYWCKCEHGRVSREDPRKTLLINIMSRPWLWCPKCREICEEVRGGENTKGSRENTEESRPGGQEGGSEGPPAPAPADLGQDQERPPVLNQEVVVTDSEGRELFSWALVNRETGREPVVRLIWAREEALPAIELIARDRPGRLLVEISQVPALIHWLAVGLAQAERLLEAEGIEPQV